MVAGDVECLPATVNMYSFSSNFLLSVQCGVVFVHKLLLKILEIDKFHLFILVL